MEHGQGGLEINKRKGIVVALKVTYAWGRVERKFRVVFMIDNVK